MVPYIGESSRMEKDIKWGCTYLIPMIYTTDNGTTTLWVGKELMSLSLENPTVENLSMGLKMGLGNFTIKMAEFSKETGSTTIRLV